MYINKSFLVTVVFTAIVAIALSVGITYARADDDTSVTCSQWEFYSEYVASARYDGFLLCRSNGELWMVDGTKKSLVQQE